jgi:hypothetical protein
MTDASKAKWQLPPSQPVPRPPYGHIATGADRSLTKHTGMPQAAHATAADISKPGHSYETTIKVTCCPRPSIRTALPHTTPRLPVLHPPLLLLPVPLPALTAPSAAAAALSAVLQAQPQPKGGRHNTTTSADTMLCYSTGQYSTVQYSTVTSI